MNTAKALRPHQAEAVAAIVRGLDIPPDGIPFNGLRGQVHAACGTGKTLTAAAAAARLVAKGRVAAPVPCLDPPAAAGTTGECAGVRGPADAGC